ncbi:hypothetical protein [Bradyrhizobium australafricanum]|uniref:hypothetical protein n=1 Tax=Bradyrhizobium australafricanum TaxID=2821406 RepID=UPI001CE3653C|nr:hypothetical protein [Bradyrhizobium australafricanum]MCA6101958.1 hypothetical protein [Bradyrhizobium australafricanum]
MTSDDEIDASLAAVLRKIRALGLELELDHIPGRRSDNIALLLAALVIGIDDKIDKLIHRSAQNVCRWSEADDSTVQLITGLGIAARPTAIHLLAQRISGTRHLVICDPYFLTSIKSHSPENYVAAVDSVLPETLKTLEIFSGKRKRQPAVAQKLNHLFKQRGIRVRSYKTDDIHDRVWISDSDQAFSVGTSFSSLGGKCAFILPLPRDDLRAFLTEIGVRKTELPVSKSV